MFRLLLDRVLPDKLRMEAAGFVRGDSPVIPYRSSGSEPNRSSSGNKDHLHLVKYKVDPKVGQQLRVTYTSGNLNFIECYILKLIHYVFPLLQIWITLK